LVGWSVQNATFLHDPSIVAFHSVKRNLPNFMCADYMVPA
jgi:hypothetical protein